jgi:hypothetical protein
LTYSRLQGGNKGLKNIIDGLKVKTLKTKITKAKWLSKLLHSHILANAYVRLIVFISLKDLITFLPLPLSPKDLKDSQPIYLVHMNSNHWILANIEA